MSLPNLSPINAIYLNMLWLILLTLHKKVEIVLTTSSTSQESESSSSGQMKGSHSPASHLWYVSVLGDLTLLQAVESQCISTSDVFLTCKAFRCLEIILLF